MSCEARTIGQQYNCSRCGLLWDMNALDPPKCKTDKQIQSEINQRGMAKVRRSASEDAGRQS